MAVLLGAQTSQGRGSETARRLGREQRETSPLIFGRFCDFAAWPSSTPDKTATLVSFSKLLLFIFRGLLQDKQEELDATQSQAHWIVLQQEAVIAETSKELNGIWELVNDWLCNLSKECSQEVQRKVTLH